METKTDTNPQAAAAEAERIIRQADASARTAEVIAKAKKPAITPPGEVRGPSSLRKDALFQAAAGNDPYVDEFAKQTAANEPNYKTGGRRKATNVDPSQFANQTIDREFRQEAYGNDFTKENEKERKKASLTVEAKRRQLEAANDASLAEADWFNRNQAAARAQARTTTKTAARAAKLVKSTAAVLPIALAQLLPMGVQLIFALISAVFLGAVGAIDAAATAEPGGGFIDWATSISTSALLTLSSIVGFDFIGIAFAGFAITYAVVFAIMLYLVGAVTIMALFRDLKPLSGNGAALKHGTLLLVLIGYSVPVMNLFPWIFVYLLALGYTQNKS